MKYEQKSKFIRLTLSAGSQLLCNYHIKHKQVNTFFYILYIPSLTTPNGAATSRLPASLTKVMQIRHASAYYKLRLKQLCLTFLSRQIKD